MQQLTIDIVSDIACPWCAIGYARLEQALQQLTGELQTSIEWHAFELNPDKTAAPEPIIPALSRKYGRSEAEMRAAQEQMVSIATELGLNFTNMQQRYTCNTFDGHRLVKWAKQFDQQTAMKQALFDAYFGAGSNVAELSVLLAAVEQAGLDVNAAEQMLASNEYIAEVEADKQRYQQAGVSAVPAFVINQKYLISGAQEPDALVQALTQIAAETAA